MGQRILVLLTTLAALFVAPLVLALGLGEASLQSNLNQPLKADIELLQVRDLSESEILVGLASSEDFERIGVDRPYFLTDLRFEIDLDNPAGPVIHVSSRKPVREPYLNFILQAQWPSGKLLREYTLLLDLPVFSDSSASSVEGAESVTSFSGAPRQQQSYQPAPSQQQQTQTEDSRYNPRSSYTPEGSLNERRPSATQRSSGPAPSPRLAGADEYSVRAGDTLWEIAAATRPDRAVSIQQTMLAIQRANPDAFINNNINLLKRGQILRIPDRGEIAQMSRQAAVQEVAVQNSAWSGGETYAASDVQLEGSSTYSGRDSGTTGREGRLKLASPEDASDAREGRGSGSGESSQAALENELAITLEELDKTDRENSELRSKIAALEEQIETQERLVEITSDELRQAELAMEQTDREEEVTEEGAEVETTETDAGEPEAETGETEVEAESVEDEVPSAEEVAEQEPADEARPAAQDTTAVVSQPVYEKTIVDHILDNIIYIGVGLLALVLLGFLFIRSRANDGFEEDDFMTDTAFDEPKSDFDVESALADEAENLDDLDEPREEVDEALPEEEEHISEAQTEDVVAEADIYIAYGKYDQAEEILLKSLEQDPNNKDARLKLVEVYAALQDGDKFDEHFAILHQIGDNEVIGRAEQLRSSISGLDIFDPNAHAAKGIEDDITMRRPQEESADDGSMDFSLDLDTGSEDSASTSDTDDFSLDLDLEEPTAQSTSEDLSLDLEDSSGSSDDLDFDLGDLDVDLNEGASDSEDVSEDEFSLDLDESSADADDSGLDFDFGDDQQGDDLEGDDFAIDLDSGEDLDGSLDLDEFAEDRMIEDNIEEDIEPMEYDLGDDDTEVGSTPEVSKEDDLSDIEFELEGQDSGSDTDLDGDFALELESPAPEESEEDFDLELSDEAIEDLDDVPDLSLDDVSEDDLDPMVGSGSEDQTLISPAVTDVDIAESQKGDELDMEGDLDLSALDQELDALTGTGDSSAADDLETGLEPEPEPAPQPVPEPEETPAPAPSMEEPVIDFDGLDEGEETSASSGGTSETEEMGEDTMFDQAVNQVPSSEADFDLPEIDPEAVDDDTDLGFLSDSDETATKLDLARAYIDMGDAEGAQDIIAEIMKEGNEQQRREADSLLKKLS